MKKVLPYEHLKDIEPESVLLPDYAVLAYAVCAMDQDSCGWGGWIIEGVGKVTEQKHHTASGHLSLPADTKQVCPSCGKVTFRTFRYQFNIGEQC